MAIYTTQVRSICEVKSGLTESVGYSKVKEVVQKSAPLIFDNFPIFDEKYRLPLEEKILRHFYTREICFETVGSWELHLNNKMNEIMPYYNKLYESELLKFDPFEDVNVTTEHDRTNTLDREKNSENTAHYHTTGDSADSREISEENYNANEGEQKTSPNLNTSTTGKTTTTVQPKERKTTEKNLYSETPQGHVNPFDDGYLTNVRQVDKIDSGETVTIENPDVTVSETGNTKTETQTSGTNSRNYNENNKEDRNSITDTDGTTKEKGQENGFENYFERIKGKRTATSYAKMLEELRSTFLNIDMMIINELEPLFFGLWE